MRTVSRGRFNLASERQVWEGNIHSLTLRQPWAPRFPEFSLSEYFPSHKQTALQNLCDIHQQLVNTEDHIPHGGIAK